MLELSCRLCRAELRRFLHDPFPCRAGNRFCDRFDLRLVNLAYAEKQSPLKMATYEHMTLSIQDAYRLLLKQARARQLLLPSDSDTFVCFVRELHYRIFSGTGLRFAGAIRTIDVECGSQAYCFVGSPPHCIESELKKLVDPCVPPLVGRCTSARLEATVRL